MNETAIDILKKRLAEVTANTKFLECEARNANYALERHLSLIESIEIGIKVLEETT